MKMQLIQMLNLVLPFLLVAMTAPMMTEQCKKWGLVDTVNKRSSHKEPTPRGVGLIIIAFSLPLIIYYAMKLSALELTMLGILMAFSLPVAAIGLWDDFSSRPAWQRLGVQSLCVIGCSLFFPPMLPALPLVVEKALIILAWVWFVNLFNFLDGSDGYAATESAFLNLALSLFVPALAPYTLVLAGASLGFLRVNWTGVRVKAFMGDVCSTWLGFVIGGFCLLAISAAGPDMLWVVITLSMLFSADATYTLIKRTIQGKTPWQAHKEHFYQRAISAGAKHSDVALQGVLVNVLLLLVVIACLEADVVWLSPLAGLVIFAVMAWRVKRIEGSA
jgi:UDP-N-acetylmuramyl pentapeptide phosphotransferase/UDP-N-acetylglucosamine-1-phosphate transferase